MRQPFKLVSEVIMPQCFIIAIVCIGVADTNLFFLPNPNPKFSFLIRIRILFRI
jgi:hypothetical protein